MKKLMHMMFLSCLKATELIEKKLLFRLSSKENVQLKIHKMMCDACTNYEQQSILIDKAMSSHLVEKSSQENTSDLKIRILKDLKLYEPKGNK